MFFFVFEENTLGIYNSYFCFGKANTWQMHVEFRAPMNQEPITSKIQKDCIINGASFQCPLVHLRPRIYILSIKYSFKSTT